MTDRKDHKDLQLPDKQENNPNKNQRDVDNGRFGGKRSFLAVVGILLFAGLASGIFIFVIAADKNTYTHIYYYDCCINVSFPFAGLASVLGIHY